jgi:hypothetical protein
VVVERVEKLMNLPVMGRFFYKQIKIFKLSDYFTKDDLEKDVNDYVVKIFKDSYEYFVQNP